MVKVAIIAGFLGSGKTSVIVHIGKTLGAKYKKKVAILVNEIGEIGVDGKYIEDYGFETKEITQGCICCTLSRDLMSTVTVLAEKFGPDVILIEPTGVAFPSRIKQILHGLMLKEKIEMAPLMTLIDGGRFMQLFREMERFTRRQIEDAEIIVINKKDLIDSKQMLLVIETSAKQLNPKATIMSISAKNEEGVDELLEIILEEEVLSDLTKPADLEEEADSKSLAGMGSHGVEIHFPQGKKVSGFKDAVSELLQIIGQKAEELGSERIGHIKASIKTPEGVMKISLLDLKRGVEISGKSIDEFQEGEMSLLAVIGELKDEQIEQIVEETISKVFGTRNIYFELKNHAH
ncbi:MAG: GTP-binding protein [Candidatus Wukongarchaeota archaeon]|nr:GTP-binding protein [Candidatus Wukongarchaeota archaeon]MDO8128380.1 GTP-binding protein [Candidatus Wukongarchaeota archaeon]